MLLLAAVAAFAQSDRPGPAPELVGEASRWGGEYLLGLGVGFGPHRVLGYGSVLGFDPLGFNLGAGYGNDALQAVGLYRQHSPGRLPYLDASDHRGGLLLLADYRSRVSPVADLSTLQLLRRAAAAYGVGLAAPMRFLDRTFIVEPRLLHGGLTRRTPELARDLIGYRFGDFSVGRLLGLLEGIRSDTGGTTALVLDLEARLHFLQTGGVPILDGIYVGTFADGGLFWDETRGAAPAGDFTVGGALGIDWLRVSLAVEAGYNHADAGFVWGVELKSFRYEANEEDDEDLHSPADLAADLRSSRSPSWNACASWDRYAPSARPARSCCCCCWWRRWPPTCSAPRRRWGSAWSPAPSSMPWKPWKSPSSRSADRYLVRVAACRLNAAYGGPVTGI